MISAIPSRKENGKKGKYWAIGDRYLDPTYGCGEPIVYTLRFGLYTFRKHQHIGFYFDDCGHVIPLTPEFKNIENHGPEE